MLYSLIIFLRANRRYVAELLLASLVVNVFVLALPLFSMLVYDKAVGNEIHDTLWALAGGMGLLLMLELCLRVARITLIEHAGARWDSRLDEKLIYGVLAAPLSRPLAVGDVLSRYRETSMTRDFLSAQYLLPLADLPFALIYVAALALISGTMVLIPLGVGGLLVLTSGALQHASQVRQRSANAAHSRKLTLLVDVLLARESLAGAGAAHMALQGFKGPAAEGARASAQARWWAQMAQQAIPLGMSAATVVLLVAGVYQVEAQALSVGGLISCTMLGGRLIANMCTLAPLVTRWREFAHALSSLGQAVDLAAASPSEPHLAVTSPAAKNAFSTEGVRLDALSFAYPGNDRRVLDELKLQLNSDQLVAVVGSSGCGKTTLLRVLAGQLAHTAGQLVCAGHVIDSEPARRQLARRVAYKAQDMAFLGGTVAQVLAPGVEAPDEARLVAALRAAGLGPVLDRGELGLSSLVGTNGVGLSGGQRQMLALARVLYAPAELVVMDEPTLGLDRLAQDGLLRELVLLKAGRCLVVATHTTELIQRADRVLVLDRGRLVADSTPSQLLGPASAVRQSA